MPTCNFVSVLHLHCVYISLRVRLAMLGARRGKTGTYSSCNVPSRGSRSMHVCAIPRNNHHEREAFVSRFAVDLYVDFERDTPR